MDAQATSVSSPTPAATRKPRDLFRYRSTIHSVALPRRLSVFRGISGQRVIRNGRRGS
jgi:hypothetical protein